jgi:hypothetical protein
VHVGVSLDALRHKPHYVWLLVLPQAASAQLTPHANGLCASCLPSEGHHSGSEAAGSTPSVASKLARRDRRLMLRQLPKLQLVARHQLQRQQRGVRDSCGPKW